MIGASIFHLCFHHLWCDQAGALMILPQMKPESPYSQIDTPSQPSITSPSTFCCRFVEIFSLHKSTERHGHCGRTRYSPHRGFGLCRIIWHNDSAGTYMYYMHDSGDALSIRSLVAVVW
ncbi:hypothetical protein EDD16DRAFT_788956 [Pisolithus croceorrhizus]|nr:hypothetical protein EDD16DRAFT_788956 [Pisolithus croceorrhizus]